MKRADTGEDNHNHNNQTLHGDRRWQSHHGDPSFREGWLGRAGRMEGWEDERGGGGGGKGWRLDRRAECVNDRD